MTDVVDFRAARELRQPREIIVERALAPAGWFTVTLRNRGAVLPESFSAWECEELAFAEADYLKRDYAPAVIRDRTSAA